MRDTRFPVFTPSNYRSGQNANEYFCYGPGAIASALNDATFETRIRPDSYFLCKKFHAQRFVSSDSVTPAAIFTTNGAISPQAGQDGPGPLIKITDTRLGRSFQSQPLDYRSVGGNAGSPNILAAPLLFEPASVIEAQFIGAPSAANWGVCYEGEKIYNPDPAWVTKIRSRFWYQFAIVDATGSTVNTLTIDLKDSVYDFAICKILCVSLASTFSQGFTRGRIRLREKGPNNMYWSNIDVPAVNFAGSYGHRFGPKMFVPPIIVPGTSQFEIAYNINPVPQNPLTIVFDGIKYPKGTNLEDWL